MRLTRHALFIAVLLLLAPIANTSFSSLTDEGENGQHRVAARDSSVVVSELLVSPNNLVSNDTSDNVYGAMDWNNDGKYGKYSDQFIELWNSGTTEVNVSDWKLEVTSGSPPCQLAWNTVIPADGRIVVFSADSDIILDYFDGDTVTVSDTFGEVADSMTYPAQDSWYGKSYVENSEGELLKVSPTPGFGPDDPESTVALNIVKCFKISDTVSSNAFLLKGRVVTMDGEQNVINQGNVMVRDGVIEGVWADNQAIPLSVDLTNAVVIETNGTIYPGLIDLHNHMHYNHIPLWDFEVHLNDEQKSAEGGYSNRYQWGNNWDYGPSITWMKNNVQSNSRWGMASEQMKYAEVQAVSGGVTAVQGSPGTSTQAWDSMLSRNVELYNFGQDGMSTCSVCGAADSDYTGSHLISQNQSGSLNAWFVHLAEGVDDSSREEFDALWDKGLIMDETVVIHGTGMERTQFDKMATVGADLVWSPISNLLLYGNTTDIRAVDAAGVDISLAPDWGPSGSKNNLHELKVADLWNTDVLNGYFSGYELAEMVTSNPAEAANWENFVGKIKAGMYADLVVMDTFHDDPYRNLIESIDDDVRLTVVQGKAVFGDTDIMTALKGDDWEPINGGGVQKAIDITSTTEIDGMQTWASVEAGMAMAMRNDVSDILEHWSAPNDVAWNNEADVQAYLDTEFDGKNPATSGVSQLKNVVVDPIFTTGDERYFDVINRSSHGNTHVDMSKLYSYYDVPMLNGERTGVNVDLGEDSTDSNQNGNSDSTSGNSQDTGTDDSDSSSDTSNNDGSTDSSTDSTVDCTANPTAEGCTDQQSNDQILPDTTAAEESETRATFLLVATIGILAIGLFFATRKSEDQLNLNQEAMIEKMWDDEILDGQTLDAGFIPAPPPLEAAPPPPSEEE
tara:strand:+ start:22521 stop:25229 length:2709 start_codon:yes stop_codon:yes gene_type:complete